MANASDQDPEGLRKQALKDDYVLQELEKFLSTPGIDSDVEDLLDTLARFYAKDAKTVEHDGVRGCLEAVSENLSEASFNLYASTK